MTQDGYPAGHGNWADQTPDGRGSCAFDRSRSLPVRIDPMVATEDARPGAQRQQQDEEAHRPEQHAANDAVAFAEANRSNRPPAAESAFAWTETDPKSHRRKRREQRCTENVLQPRRTLRKRDGSARNHEVRTSKAGDPIRDSWRQPDVDPAHRRSAQEQTETCATERNARARLAREIARGRIHLCLPPLRRMRSDASPGTAGSPWVGARPRDGSCSLPLRCPG